MRNYWIGKSVERKIKKYKEEQARLLREVMMWLLPKVEPTTRVSWDTPIISEIPQENKMYQKQVCVCPVTGVKHNFSNRGIVIGC